MSRNRRTVIVGPVYTGGCPSEVVDFRLSVQTHTMEAIAARKGRVVVWPSVRRIEKTSVTGDAILWATAMTAPRPGWKRKAVLP